MAPGISPLIFMVVGTWLAIANCMPITSANGTSSLERRQCTWNAQTHAWDCDLYLPSLQHIVRRMQNVYDDGKASATAIPFFYVNLFDGAVTPDNVENVLLWCSQWLEAHNVDFYSTYNSLNKAWYTQQSVQIWDNTQAIAKDYGGREGTVFINWAGCYNQALDFAVQKQDAEVYLFTRAGRTWSPRTQWAMLEFWPLTREGGPVKRVLRVDPRPPEAGGLGLCAIPELLWERGRDPPLPAIWQCPVKENQP
jgi:hypothetical protein